MTDGGLTAQTDAATFELLKEATLQYYKLYSSDELDCKITMCKYIAGNCVHMTVRVLLLKSKDFYTVNMYLTKCSFYINGKSMNRFLETDLENITKMTENATLNGNPIDISEFNTKLRVQLNSMLSGKTMAKDNTDIGMIQAEQEGEQKAQYSKCSRNVKSKAVYCEASEHWFHYHCEKLSEQEIAEIENHKVPYYVCEKCKNDRNKSGHSE